jgi:hypothetical protein
MKLLSCFSRRLRIARRKKALGERYTSDLIWREFSTEQLRTLNPSVEFSNVKTIYEIGTSNGKERYFKQLVNLIESDRIHKVPKLNNTVDMGEDELGLVPVGEYLTTYLWEFTNGEFLVQVIKGSYDKEGNRIAWFKRFYHPFNVKQIKSRKLIFPA